MLLGINAILETLSVGWAVSPASGIARTMIAGSSGSPAYEPHRNAMHIKLITLNTPVYGTITHILFTLPH